MGDNGKEGTGGGGQQGMQVLRQGIQARDDSPGAGGGLGSFKVINLLQVRDNQQVMLEVKVAEVNRTEAEKLGFEFQKALGKAGSAWTQIMASVIGGGALNFMVGDVGSQYTKFGEGNFLIDAEKKDEVIKILAEPTIVAISGQEASFLVGGEILIPVNSGLSSVSLQSKQFGVSLKFTPTVLEEGRINLTVNPEVSELVGFEQVASSGLGAIVAVPTFRTRRISTTVQLREGQSLAIGGLLQDNFKEQIKRFPILGEVPILGALFSSSSFEMGKTELMIIVTPRLVKPLQPDYKLPTDAFIRPERGEFLLQGRLEGAADNSDTKDASDPSVGKGPNSPVEAAELGGFQMK
jgi:pilus assembly protein CpaC